MFVAGFIGSPQMNFIKGRLSNQEGEIFFHEKTFKVKTAEDMNDKLLPYVGKEIVMGIRPENIYDKLFTHGTSAKNTLMATVENIEPMGNLIYLYLTTGEHDLIASVDAQERVTMNKDIEIVFDMQFAKFFDIETESSIV